jgi:glycosyltransferase involved in cell wall biosynthesis
LIRIAFIDKQRSWTGQTKRTLLIAGGLDRRQFEPLAICQPGSVLARKLRKLNIPVFEVPMNGIHQFSAVLEFKRIFQDHRVNLVDTHGYRDHIISVGAVRLTATRVLLRTKHNSAPLKSGAFSRFVYNNLTDRVIAISEYIRQVLIKSGMHPQNVVTIHSAVDVDRFCPHEKTPAILAEFGLTAQTPVVGTVARIHQSKGFEHLLQAIAAIVKDGIDCKFLIVGKGREKLAGQLKTLDIADHVITAGYREDVAELLSIVDLFVLPSLKEGLGTAILEAMAMGKPIVSTRVGGIPEAVQHGVNGLLVPPANAPALAVAIRQLLAAPDQLLAMGRQSRILAERHFNQTAMIAKTQSFFHSMLDKKG